MPKYDTFTINQVPVFISGRDDGLSTSVKNLGPGTVYYGPSTVTSTTYTGAIISGATAVIELGRHFVAATQARIVTITQTTGESLTAGASPSALQCYPETYGALGDGRILTDATITTGTAVLNSASSPFTSADVGKIVAIPGAGTGSPADGKGFTISAYTSPSSVTLSATASATVTSSPAAYGTDDSAAFTAAFAAVNVNQGGGTVKCRPRMYMIGSRITIPGGITLEGDGIDYNGDDPFPARGTVLCAGGAGVAATFGVVKMGDVLEQVPISDPSFDSGHTFPRLLNLCVYGANAVASAVTVIAARWRIDFCQIGGGSTQQVNVAGGQNGALCDTIVNGTSRGIGVVNAGGDNKFYRNQIRGWKTIGFDVSNAGSHFELGENSIYPNTTEDAGATAAVRLQASVISGIIIGNVFGNYQMNAPDILLVADANCRDHAIVGNQFYKTGGLTGVTVPCIRVDTTAGAPRGLLVTGNVAHGPNTADTGYKSLVDVTGSNLIHAWVITGNYCGDTQNVWTAAGAQVPAVCANNAIRFNATGPGVKTFVSDTRSQSVLSGDGATTVFTIAHGVKPAPTCVIVTPGSVAASAAHFATADATNITVTYAVAPANAASNLTLNWYVGG